MRTSRVATFLIAIVAAGAAAAGSPWIHLRVEESAKGADVDINLPLSVAHIALDALAGEIEGKLRIEDGRIDLGKTALTLADLEQMWTELRDVDDATLFSSEGNGERIRVFKLKDRLNIHVDDAEHGERVRIEIPAGVVDALLAPAGDELDLAGALASLDEGFRGDLVEVVDGDRSVRIWID